MRQAKLTDVVKALDLEVVNASSKYNNTILETADMNRPGMQFAGYMQQFPYKRLQIIGLVEYNYYEELPKKIYIERFKEFFKYPIPALIFARGLDIAEDILRLSQENDITILRSPLVTTNLQSKLTTVIGDLLAEEISLHGVLVDVYGLGVC